MRYFVELQFDGRRYHGWQVQPNGNSVQAELQRALSLLLRTDTSVTGAGRTDAGVHALLMVAHFDSAEELHCEQLTYKLNKLLPPDIAVYNIYKVKETMHARFSAKSRTYHYRVHLQKDPFAEGRSARLYAVPDFNLMNEAAETLLQYADFTSFSKLHTQVATNICHITCARWVQADEQKWCFEISADRFLRNMVRAIVGTLLQIGYGKLTTDDLRRIIEGKDRCQAGDSAPACGLYLVKIDY